MGDTINRRGVGMPQVPATGFAPMTSGTFQNNPVPTMPQLVAAAVPAPTLTANRGFITGGGFGAGAGWRGGGGSRFKPLDVM